MPEGAGSGFADAYNCYNKFVLKIVFWRDKKKPESMNQANKKLYYPKLNRKNRS